MCHPSGLSCIVVDREMAPKGGRGVSANRDIQKREVYWQKHGWRGQEEETERERAERMRKVKKNKTALK